MCLEPPETELPGWSLAGQSARVPGGAAAGSMLGGACGGGAGEALASILSFLFLFGFLLDFLNQLLIIFLEEQQGETLALHQLHALWRPHRDTGDASLRWSAMG